MIEEKTNSTALGTQVAEKDHKHVITLGTKGLFYCPRCAQEWTGKEAAQALQHVIEEPLDEKKLIQSLLNQWEQQTNEGCVKVENDRYYVKSCDSSNNLSFL